MGMDVYGRKPTGPKGEYFRNNVWWWRPLWIYCCQVGDKILSDRIKEYGHSNDGVGPMAAGATKLGQALIVELESGATETYARDYQNTMKSLPDEVCEYCQGTGKRTDMELEEGCNGCKGKGKRRPFATWYSFSVDNVREFAEFCLQSGGFRIL